MFENLKILKNEDKMFKGFLSNKNGGSDMKLKKVFSTAMLSALLLGTAGCANPAADIIEKVTGPKTAEDVLQKSVEATNTLSNYSMDMKVEQKISSAEGEMNQTLESSGEVTLKPAAVHQNIKMEQGQGTDSNNLSLSMEIYMDGDNVYTLDSTTNKWTQLKGDLSAATGVQNLQEQGPDDQLKMMKDLVDGATLVKEKDQYVISFEKKSEQEIKQFVLDNLIQSFVADEEVAKVLEKTLKVEKMSTELTFDKETFYPEELKIQLALSFDVNGESIKLNQNLNANYKDINKTQKIELPKEIKSEAVKVEK